MCIPNTWRLRKPFPGPQEAEKQRILAQAWRLQNDSHGSVVVVALLTKDLRMYILQGHDKGKGKSCSNPVGRDMLLPRGYIYP